MKPGVSYDVSYSVVSSYDVENIDIYPYQGELDSSIEKPFIKNTDFYNSNSNYPNKKLIVSEPMIMRDLEIGSVSLIPYNYNPESKTLTVYSEVKIDIIESGTRKSRQIFLKSVQGYLKISTSS